MTERAAGAPLRAGASEEWPEGSSEGLVSGREGAPQGRQEGAERSPPSQQTPAEGEKQSDGGCLQCHLPAVQSGPRLPGACAG